MSKVPRPIHKAKITIDNHSVEIDFVVPTLKEIMDVEGKGTLAEGVFLAKCIQAVSIDGGNPFHDPTLLPNNWIRELAHHIIGGGLSPNGGGE